MKTSIIKQTESNRFQVHDDAEIYFFGTDFADLSGIIKILQDCVCNTYSFDEFCINSQ